MNNAKSKKSEIIEQALQEAVGGGLASNVEIPICIISCHIFSINVCHVDLCDVNLPF